MKRISKPKKKNVDLLLQFLKKYKKSENEYTYRKKN